MRLLVIRREGKTHPQSRDGVGSPEDRDRDRDCFRSIGRRGGDPKRVRESK